MSAVMGKKKPVANANPWPERLRSIRARLNLTQQQAADKIAAPVSTWQNWEQGHRRPNPMIAKLIEVTFGK